MANDVHKLCGPLLLSRSPDIVEKYIFVYWFQIESKEQVKGTFINFNWKFGKRKFDTLLNLITCLHIILSLSYRRRCCASFGVHSNIQKFIEFPSNSPTLPTPPLPHMAHHNIVIQFASCIEQYPIDPYPPVRPWVRYTLFSSVLSVCQRIRYKLASSTIEIIHSIIDGLLLLHLDRNMDVVPLFPTTGSMVCDKYLANFASTPRAKGAVDSSATRGDDDYGHPGDEQDDDNATTATTGDTR